MRPGCVSACIDHVTYMYGQTDGRTDGWEDSQNMLVDHLFQCRISPWPKTAEKHGFCTGVRDRPTNRRRDRRKKQPSSKGVPQNMLVDHLFQFRISECPKTIEKRGFCTCVTDIQTDGRTDGKGVQKTPNHRNQ